MPKAIRLYVRYVEALNRVVGRATMYLMFVMIGVLLTSSVARSILDLQLLWVVEMAQMTMAAYYLLGGAYSMQIDGHVRMDLLYCRWTVKRMAFMDTITSAGLLFYIVVLFYGAISSTQYAIKYGQVNYSAWAPPMAPIKIVMTIGIGLMLLQVIATFFRDLATARGEQL